MLTFVSQDRLIKKLNQYFTSQNLPLKCDEEGICNGLAYVYSQYVLMGSEEKFHRLLEAIAGDKVDELLEPAELELFITHVLLSFMPEQYNKELNQAKSILAFGESETVFELGMVLKDKEWASVFKDIDLKDDEVMLVNSIDHTIAISRKNGKYIVYDPNYLFGFYPIKSEQALIRELHKNVFAGQGKELGLRVNIVKKKSEVSSLIKRNALNFYQNYIIKDNINLTAKINDRTTNNVLLAIECDDKDSIDYLLSLGTQVDDRALGKAIIGNHAKVIPALIENQSFENRTINSSIIVAIEHGRLEAFNALMMDHRFKNQFNTVFLNINKPMLIKNAAQGGNLKLLQLIIDEFKKNTTRYHDIKSAMQKNDHCKSALIAAIDGGSTECIRLLINTLKSYDIEVSNKIKIECFLHALKSNQPYVCTTLLKELPPDDLMHIQMSLSMVEKTNLHILKELKNHGVIFSEKAEAIINKKEQRAVGVWLSFQIALDMIFEYLYKKQDITCLVSDAPVSEKAAGNDIKKNFKDSFQEIKRAEADSAFLKDQKRM